MILLPFQKYFLKGQSFHHSEDPKISRKLLYTHEKLMTMTDKHSCFKCKGKCDLCRNFLVESDHFTSASSNRTYQITQHLHCKSKIIIYLVTCTKCSVQYVGSTSNKFIVRFRNHKSAMKTNKNTCEVATHFNKTFQFHNH